MPLHTHTTPPHIDLARRFRDLTSAELEAPEHLAALNESPTLGATYDWDQLLARPRVVILAEAGTGKTVEMELQAARCEHCGKRAFFVALEELYRNRLENILKPGEAQALEAWKLDSRAKAWFFLDSVDELKLVSGKLRSALVQLAHTLDGHLDRAHIIVSSRPTDWRLIDREALETLLPVKAPAPQDEPDAEDRFLARLRDSQSGRRGAPLAQPVISETLSIVQLLPLSNPQIVRLAQNYGIDDSTAFLAEIRRHDAWAFARRPLDLGSQATGSSTNPLALGLGSMRPTSRRSSPTTPIGRITASCRSVRREKAPSGSRWLWLSPACGRFVPRSRRSPPMTAKQR